MTLCVCPYHGGQDGQEERRGGNVTCALGEDGDEEAEDDGDRPRRDGVEGRHLSAQPAGQSRHLNQKLSCKILDFVRPNPKANLKRDFFPIFSNTHTHLAAFGQCKASSQ